MAVNERSYEAVKPIAVDVLGGDNLDEVWRGIEEAHKQGLPMLLVGPESVVGKSGIDFIDADVQVPMNLSGDDVVMWVRGADAKESTMYQAVQAVEDGRASAVFSSGSSAGMYAIAHSVLGFQKRASRPGIATSIPRLADMSGFNVLCDSGAHLSPTPESMVYNAVLAAVVAQVRHGNNDPVISLLANGEERTKGDPTTKAARYILENVELPLGVLLGENVEGKHLTTGPADVIVANGLLGNIGLKSVEGAAKSALFGYANYFNRRLATMDFDEMLRDHPELDAIIKPMRRVLGASEVTRFVTTLAGTALIDFGYGPAHPDSYGGAVVPGMNGVVVIGHGSIKAKGVPNAVATGLELAESGLIDATSDALNRFLLPKELIEEAKGKYGLGKKQAGFDE